MRWSPTFIPDFSTRESHPRRWKQTRGSHQEQSGAQGISSCLGPTQDETHLLASANPDRIQLEWHLPQHLPDEVLLRQIQSARCLDVWSRSHFREHFLGLVPRSESVFSTEGRQDRLVLLRDYHVVALRVADSEPEEVRRYRAQSNSRLGYPWVRTSFCFDRFLSVNTPSVPNVVQTLTIIRFMNESHYMFVYWIIGTFNNDIETLTLSVGIVRSFESFGSAVSFGLGAAHGVSPMANLLTAFVMFVICIPTTSLVVFQVPEHPTEKEHLIEESTEDVAFGKTTNSDPGRAIEV